jgi:cell division septum initiation protein DivIVA
MDVYAQSFWVELGWLQEALGIHAVLTTISKPDNKRVEAQVQPLKLAAEAAAADAAAAVAQHKKVTAAEKQHAVLSQAAAERAAAVFEKAQREASQHTLNMRYCPELRSDQSTATGALVHIVLNQQHYRPVYPNAEQWNLLRDGKVSLHTSSIESCAQSSKKQRRS